MGDTFVIYIMANTPFVVVQADITFLTLLPCILVTYYTASLGGLHRYMIESVKYHSLWESNKTSIMMRFSC